MADETGAETGTILGGDHTDANSGSSEDGHETTDDNQSTGDVSDESTETDTSTDNEEDSGSDADAGDSDNSSDGGDDATDGDDEELLAPENYEAFTLPDGFEMDEANLAEAVIEFKDLDLTQEEAQRLIDMQSKFVEKAMQAEFDAREAENLKNQNDLKNDKDFGGDNLKQSLKVANNALNVFGSEAFDKILADSGVGNHPEMMRFLLKIGKTLQEDNPSEDVVSPSGDRASTRSERMYDN